MSQTKSTWGVYGYQPSDPPDGELRDVLLRSFTTRRQAEGYAEPLSTTIVSAEVREIETTR